MHQHPRMISLDGSVQGHIIMPRTLCPARTTQLYDSQIITIYLQEKKKKHQVNAYKLNKSNKEHFPNNTMHNIYIYGLDKIKIQNHHLFFLPNEGKNNSKGAPRCGRQLL